MHPARAPALAPAPALVSPLARPSLPRQHGLDRCCGPPRLVVMVVMVPVVRLVVASARQVQPEVAVLIRPSDSSARHCVTFGAAAFLCRLHAVEKAASAPDGLSCSTSTDRASSSRPERRLRRDDFTRCAMVVRRVVRRVAEKARREAGRAFADGVGLV